MSLHVECSEPQRSFKRAFALSDDASNSVNPRPTKRYQHLPPTPPTPSLSLKKFSQSSRPEAVLSSPPGDSRLPRKPALVDLDPASCPVPEKSRLDYWLEDLPNSPPTRASSCPPDLEHSIPPEILDIGEGQPLSFDILQEISQSQRPKLEAGSLGSGRSSRPPTSHADYRRTLRKNGICIDHTGAEIPPELRSFLDLHILQERSSKVSPESITEAVNTAIQIADSPEGNVYDLQDTAMLPIKRSKVGRGGNTPWFPDGLPRNDVYGIPLAAPKADIHLGYPIDHNSGWTDKEDAVIDHVAARRLTKPAKGNCFPFFTLELKSEAMGGNLWQAENQAAGSGASCVNATRWVFREAYPSRDQSVMKSIAFSACVTQRLAIFYVHFYSAEKSQHYMSWIATCETMRHVQKSNHLVENILEHCLGARQTNIRTALGQLYPFPSHWKNSRPASVMDSQNPSADYKDETSNKTRRTE
ncbi:MAG: hypothetical protein HETSPECPRED_003219 [Heterodermia speciosa]|uniref:DUF7924 domain-containing protein n=1 Tax=Heterodermia speciosa TaxID=116794 RepID=A0A8H3PJ04_9LECA|nr:MAG: hypothetical protein HETSPECPRED_003219 [Heterodermia speciosa]